MQPDLPRTARGAQPSRRGLLRMTKALGSGDVVTVTRIDRLARSTFDLFAIVKQILDAGAQFWSLAEPRADTATSTGRLMVVILGGLADVERDLIHTHDGRARKSQGERQEPRPPVQDPHKSQEVLARRESGELLTEIAGSYKVQCGDDFKVAGMSRFPRCRNAYMGL